MFEQIKSSKQKENMYWRKVLNTKRKKSENDKILENEDENKFDFSDDISELKSFFRESIHVHPFPLHLHPQVSTCTHLPLYEYTPPWIDLATARIDLVRKIADMRNI